MRLSTTIFITTLCLGCGRDAPISDTPAPSAPEAPEAPEAPVPLPDADPGADGVFRGVDSVLGQLTGEGPVPDRVRVEIELRAGDAVRLTVSADVAPMTRGIEYGTTHARFGLSDDAWLVQHWAPIDWVDYADVDGGRVRVLDGDALLAEEAFALRGVPVRDDTCDVTGFASRCADGYICALLPRPVEGQCFRDDLAGGLALSGAARGVRRRGALCGRASGRDRASATRRARAG